MEIQMELEVTWKRATKVWWAYFWRSLIAMLGAMVIGGIVGGIIGFIIGMMGSSRESIQLLVTPIGMIIGILMSIVPIKLILGKNFGDFRLVLLKNPAEKSDK